MLFLNINLPLWNSSTLLWLLFLKGILRLYCHSFNFVALKKSQLIFPNGIILVYIPDLWSAMISEYFRVCPIDIPGFLKSEPRSCVLHAASKTFRGAYICSSQSNYQIYPAFWWSVSYSTRKKKIKSLQHCPRKCHHIPVLQKPLIRPFPNSFSKPASPSCSFSSPTPAPLACRWSGCTGFGLQVQSPRSSQ